MLCTLTVKDLLIEKPVTTFLKKYINNVASAQEQDLRTANCHKQAFSYLFYIRGTPPISGGDPVLETENRPHLTWPHNQSNYYSHFITSYLSWYYQNIFHCRGTICYIGAFANWIGDIHTTFNEI